MKRIPLNDEGDYTVIDDADFEWLSRWKWKLSGEGYACRTSWDKNRHKWICVFLHRLIAGTPPELQTDHINRDRLDNRRANLRNVTGSENTRNQGLDPRNTSGFKGVTWDKSRQKWIASTKHLGKWVYLGRHVTAEDAASARAAFDSHLDQHGIPPKSRTRPNSRRDHCPRMHKLAQPNLVPSQLPARSCLACSRAQGIQRFHPDMNFQEVADRHYALIMEAAS